MLQVRDLHAFYGKSHILRGVNLEVGAGEIVALFGRNGAGRSTLAKALMGMVQCQGSILLRGQSILGRKPYAIANLGIGYVPENRDIFPQLTVHQNLLLGQKTQRSASRWSFDDMYRMFAQLRARAHTPAGVLSGGEQQMLTLCRTLMGDPDLVIIDEPTEGLAPQMVELVAQFLQTLRQHGIGVLLIEQKHTIAMHIADRCLVMGHGRVVFAGAPASLQSDEALRKEWLEV